EARKDQGVAPVNEVATVELGTHLDGQVAVPQRRVRVRLIRNGKGEVPAHAHEHLDFAPCHRWNNTDGIEPPLARRCDAACPVEAREPGLARPVVDPAGPVALDVRVATNRTRAGSFSTEIAAEQEYVDDFPDRVDRVLLLRHSETPADDRAPRFAVDLA